MERLGALLGRELSDQTRLRILWKEQRMGRAFSQSWKALLSVYPGEDAFTVQTVLGQTLAEKASSLKLSKNAKKVLENAHQFPEGRWLFIKANSRQDISDIQQLVLLKERPKTSP